jgi:hypothetical protein
VRDWKLGCRVNEVYDGVAHIVEQTYDDSFTVWYGRIDLTASPKQFLDLCAQDVRIDLEDGRRGRARCSEARCNRNGIRYPISLVVITATLTLWA